MTKPIIVAMAAALALSGCGESSAPPAANTVDDAAEANAVGNEAAGDNVLAIVLDMPDAQRNIVFVRAIMDADLPCEGVIKSERVEDQDGQPMWRADCKNGDKHLISITPDGTAHLISRSKASR